MARRGAKWTHRRVPPKGRLDYIESLGVNVVWLNPVYQSPNDDNGYDIRDCRAIMREMGTMADFGS